MLPKSITYVERYANVVAGYHAREMRSAYKILVRKLEEKRQFGRPRHVCGDNIKVDLGEIGWAVKSGAFFD
jgi:hypothetical protein